jgi:hypothetical protein
MRGCQFKPTVATWISEKLSNRASMAAGPRAAGRGGNCPVVVGCSAGIRLLDKVIVVFYALPRVIMRMDKYNQT